MPDFHPRRARVIEQALRYEQHLIDTNQSTFRSWRAMHARCYNSDNLFFKYYGARGITVCARWFDFETFLRDMGPRPDGRTLDRINNDGNYEPDNCRWATAVEQANNKRQRRRTWRPPQLEPLPDIIEPEPGILIPTNQRGLKTLLTRSLHTRL